MWRISKFFQLPLSDPRIQDMTPYDLEFYEYSIIADDPKKLEQLKNHFYDPEFDEWVEEFEREQAEKSNKEQYYDDSYEEYDVSESVGYDDDWEEVS